MSLPKELIEAVRSSSARHVNIVLHDCYRKAVQSGHTGTKEWLLADAIVAERESRATEEMTSTMGGVIPTWKFNHMRREAVGCPFSRDLLEVAWGIIANANGGDWSKATDEWREAAERWRDEYHGGPPQQGDDNAGPITAGWPNPPADIAGDIEAMEVHRKRTKSRAASIERVLERLGVEENCAIHTNSEGTEKRIFTARDFIGTFTAAPLDAEWKWDAVGDNSAGQKFWTEHWKPGDPPCEGSAGCPDAVPDYSGPDGAMQKQIDELTAKVKHNREVDKEYRDAVKEVHEHNIDDMKLRLEAYVSATEKVIVERDKTCRKLEERLDAADEERKQSLDALIFLASQTPLPIERLVQINEILGLPREPKETE